MKDTLIEFKAWCASNIPTKDYFTIKKALFKYKNYINDAQSESQNVSENEKTKKICCSVCEYNYVIKEDEPSKMNQNLMIVGGAGKMNQMIKVNFMNMQNGEVVAMILSCANYYF